MDLAPLIPLKVFLQGKGSAESGSCPLNSLDGVSAGQRGLPRADLPLLIQWIVSLKCLCRVKESAKSGSTPPDTIDCVSELEGPPKAAVGLSDTLFRSGKSAKSGCNPLMLGSFS